MHKPSKTEVYGWLWLAFMASSLWSKCGCFLWSCVFCLCMATSSFPVWNTIKHHFWRVWTSMYHGYLMILETIYDCLPSSTSQLPIICQWFTNHHNHLPVSSLNIHWPITAKCPPVIKRGKLRNPLELSVSIAKSPISIVYFPVPWLMKPEGSWWFPRKRLCTPWSRSQMRCRPFCGTASKPSWTIRRGHPGGQIVV